MLFYHKDNTILEKFNIEEGELEIRGKAEKIFNTGVVEEETEITTSSSLEEFKNKRDRLEEVALKIKDSWVRITGSCQERVRLSSRADPTSLLRTLLRQRKFEFNNEISVYTGALAVLWTKMKRLSRCISLIRDKSELEKELENKGHENWSPRYSPEWVCLELELDLMIRPKQVDVARQMIKMPNERNGVMQLNMGEGKTSVITPMLCCVLGVNQVLCRVTVLSSMLNMNEKILGFAIGGLINKRVYLMPCKRDLEISMDTVEAIQESLEECMNRQGVLLTLPEHRLSFRLLAYDNALEDKIKSDYFNSGYSWLDTFRCKSTMKMSKRNKKTVKKSKELGLKLWQTENWLRKHARDILDESDELLNAKYQLVYTVGEKIDLDGGEIRWICAENLLNIVKSLGKALHEKYGDNVVEWDGKESKPHQFPVFRLLDTSAYFELTSKVGELLLEEFTLDSKEKEEVKRFLVDKDGDFESISTIFKEENASKEVNKLLTYAGYLRKGILTLGLSKRWRVEYGVDTEKTFSLMAVPFRAKDFPAERTEFGHPDLAILLTHLSYYYSGLNDLQLKETWEDLQEKRDSESIYASWLDKCNQESVPGHLRNFKGINLKDSVQKEDLFNLLRLHMSAIDFFLSNKVFPSECKQFPSKLVMTSWDLCYEGNRYPTTGFSGTNDSRILLPLQITQQDLSSLKDTNKKMKETLLKPENKNHRHLRMGVTCREILEHLKEDNLRVLIDAGALMLELNNDQVAKLWLDLDKSLEGVLYFNKRNELTVKCRVSGSECKDIPLELTPYQNSLEKVGVFLDDQHTRGTDLKFPNEWRAVVTIGAGMKRDKLTQACMRMRKLEFNQSVSFYLSHEVFDKIKKMQGTETMEQVSTHEVLQWVQQNTDKFNEDGLLYWAISGKNYAQRLAAEEFYLNETRDYYSTQRIDNRNLKDNEKAFHELAKRCLDDEVTKLMTLYGKRNTEKQLYNIIPFWFNHSLRKIIRFPNSYEESKIVDLFKEIRNGVTLRCYKCIPNKLHIYSGGGESLEEEQEKELETELEREVEEERIVQRPGKVNHAEPMLHKNVLKIVKTGEEVKAVEGIQIAPEIFGKTTFWGKVQPNAWSQNVFASTDFISVLEKDPERKVESFYFGKSFLGRANTDLFLRPVEFFIVSKGEVPTVLFLSSYEVNKLLPLFRQGKANVSLHMFSPRKNVGQGLLWDNPGLTFNPPDMIFSPGLEMYSLPTIFLAAGNLYFSSMEEQKLFVEFLCLTPKPWGTKEEEGFEKGEITKKGFMLPGYEGRRDQNEEELSKGFAEDPEGLVRKILSCRHSVLSEMSHMVRILNERRFVNMQ